MSTRRLVIFITFAALFAMAARVSMGADTWWHLATGRWILEHGAIPTTDIFSSTRFGEAWRGAQVAWIAQVILYSVYEAFGPGGVNLLVAALITTAYALVYPTWQGDPFMKAFTLVLAATAGAVYWSGRPYMFGYIWLAAMLLIFERYRNGKGNQLWLLPILQWLYANSHGASFLSLLVWGVYGLDAGLKWLAERKEMDLRKRVFQLALIGILMIAALALSPTGLDAILYPAEQLSVINAFAFIQEWQSPDFHQLHLQPFMWLFLATVAAIGFSSLRLSLVDFLLFAGFGFMAFLSARNIGLFALIAPMVLTRHTASLLREKGWVLALSGQTPNKLLSGLNIFLAILIGLAALVKAASVYPAPVNRTAYGEFFPIQAVDVLNEVNPPGDLFNSYNYGGYLVFFAPEYLVFIDGRADLYGDDGINDWLSISNTQPGWQDKLTQYGINTVFVEPHWPLVDALADEGWQLLFQDSLAVIYTRP